MSTQELIHVGPVAGSSSRPAHPVTQVARRCGEGAVTFSRTSLLWTRAHWAWSGAWTVLAVAFGWLMGWHVGAVLAAVTIGVPATVAGILRPVAPVFYTQHIADPMQAFVHLLWWMIRWEKACEGARMGYSPRRSVWETVNGERIPREEKFKPARCLPVPNSRGLELRMRVPRGMSCEEVQARTPALAAAMRAKSYGYRRVSASEVRIRLTLVDALNAVIVAPPPSNRTDLPIILGCDESGSPVIYDPRDPVHVAFQGMTRSGKSVLTYVLLAGLAMRSDVVVTGCDPSGVLLRPWKEGRGGEWIALGTRDMERHALVLERLVAEMDKRIEWLAGSGVDKFETFDADLPVLVVILEEWPGLLSAAKATDSDLCKRIERAHGRLVKEGLKVGVRLVTLAQRMSARAMDTDDRSNYGLRATLRVDNGDSLRMLHDGSATPPFDEVRAWPAGVGIVEQPGRPLMRWRVFLLDYRGYIARVRRGLAAQHGVGGWSASSLVPPVVTVTSVETDDDTEPITVVQGETVEPEPKQKPRRTQPKQPRRRAA